MCRWNSKHSPKKSPGHVKYSSLKKRAERITSRRQAFKLFFTRTIGNEFIKWTNERLRRLNLLRDSREIYNLEAPLLDETEVDAYLAVQIWSTVEKEDNLIGKDMLFSYAILKRGFCFDKKTSEDKESGKQRFATSRWSIFANFLNHALRSAHSVFNLARSRRRPGNELESLKEFKKNLAVELFYEYADEVSEDPFLPDEMNKRFGRLHKAAVELFKENSSEEETECSTCHGPLVYLCTDCAADMKKDHWTNRPQCTQIVRTKWIKWPSNCLLFACRTGSGWLNCRWTVLQEGAKFVLSRAP